MALPERSLKLEIGSEAFSELTDEEVYDICQRYDVGEEKLAGMKAFELLMKKFRPTYRLGRLYEDLSAKFEHYRRMFVWYAQQLKAGRSGEGEGTDYVVERTKWLQ